MVAKTDPLSLDMTSASTDQLRKHLQAILEADGPTHHDYPPLKQIMDRISTLRAQGVITEEDNDRLWDEMGEVGTAKTLMGFIYRKPHGYHGDFEIIDKFHTNHIASESHLRRWDQWIQALDATQAVRNRKQFLIDRLAEISTRSGPIHVLNVGSGPCRDVAEAIEVVAGDFRFTCVDIDPNAIEYSRRILDGRASRIHFIQKNVLRLDQRDEFDLAWSSGLFDYLDDRQFIIALKKMHRAVKLGGQTIVGNFSTRCEAQSAMEWGNWRLHHRSELQLHQLAAAAGVPDRCVSVQIEPMGVNLFLHITRSPADKASS